MIYKTLLALSAAGVAMASYSSASPETLKQLFESFKQEHKKNYATMDEELHRFQVFVNTLKVIDTRNAKGGAVHGITKFADLTQEEFETQFLDLNLAEKIRGLNASKVTVPKYSGSATAVDHTGSQTTAVKDQANCGSCWAHAAAQQIESDGMRLLGNPSSKTVSVQQLVSCDDGKGQNGCFGGLQEPAFDYVRLNGGIVSESVYPYSSGNGRTGKCDTTIVKSSNYVMGVTGYNFIIDSSVTQTENSFTDYVLSSGTISIGVDATTWNTYKSGVMSDCGAGTSINHAVQLTGVDTSSYWKIRNSWGSSWGEAGSIRISYGSNTCGLATEGGSYTTVYNI